LLVGGDERALCRALAGQRHRLGIGGGNRGMIDERAPQRQPRERRFERRYVQWARCLVHARLLWPPYLRRGGAGGGIRFSAQKKPGSQPSGPILPGGRAGGQSATREAKSTAKLA